MNYDIDNTWISFAHKHSNGIGMENIDSYDATEVKASIMLNGLPYVVEQVVKATWSINLKGSRLKLEDWFEYNEVENMILNKDGMLMMATMKAIGAVLRIVSDSVNPFDMPTDQMILAYLPEVIEHWNCCECLISEDEVEEMCEIAKDEVIRSLGWFMDQVNQAWDDDILAREKLTDHLKPRFPALNVKEIVSQLP